MTYKKPNHKDYVKYEQLVDKYISAGMKASTATDKAKEELNIPDSRATIWEDVYLLNYHNRK